MPDPSDRQDPPTRRAATPRSRRPRFALPADHQDDRVSERIEAFLEGPARSRRRARGSTTVPPRSPRRAIPLDTRADWDNALRHEDARLARYGRPCALLVVELRDVAVAAVDRIAPALGLVVRHEARETDRVTRVGPGRFHVLLPETSGEEAEALAQRVREEAAARLPAGAGATVCALVTAPRRGETLAVALTRLTRDLR